VRAFLRSSIAGLGLLGTALGAQQSADVVLTLRVVDAEGKRPVVAAAIEVDGRLVTHTDSLGEARLTLRAPFLLRTRRLGYAPSVQRVSNAEANPLIIRLRPVAQRLAATQVSGRLGGTALGASSIVDADAIAERMAPSIAAMVASEPGVSMKTNGPMAAQPVIRGLSGDRVTVLEDGMRTGDVATTAADHAITIEPLTIERIDVVRGPAGLLYGSNSLGGVLNVVRGDVPSAARPLSWSTTSYGESVNGGLGVAGRASGAVGDWAWHADAAARNAGDVRTPQGDLPFTDITGFETGAGVSRIGARGHAGIALREYRSFYGVPSSFGGVTLPGAHDGGVVVDVQRTALRADAAYRPRRGPIESLAFGGNAVRFEQAEAEQGGFIGTRFGQLSANAEASAQLHAGPHRVTLGSAAQWRDLRAEGSFTGTRPAVQRSVAMFAVDEFRLRAATITLGLRADHLRFVPLDSTETLLLRDIRSRSFTAITGAVGASLPLRGGWSVSAQVARAFRPPSIEELYSAGPHLGNYAYEIGRPDLRAERGVGADLVLRWQGSKGSAEFTGFAMQLDDFIRFAPQLDSATGRPMRDPRLRRYIVYRPVQGAATLHGVEARITALPAQDWTLEASGSWTIGRDRSIGGPLPAIPPPQARAEIRRALGAITLGVSVDARMPFRAVLTRPDGDVDCTLRIVNGEAEALPAEYCPSPGVALIGAMFAWRVPFAPRPMRLTLSGENLLNTEWRDPLWRAKLVAPQPGRNLRLTVQVSR
jgi:iron complex outermembrane receptor protein